MAQYLQTGCVNQTLKILTPSKRYIIN